MTYLRDLHVLPLPRIPRAPAPAAASSESEAWDIVHGYHREPRYPIAPEPTVERPAVLEIEIEPSRRNPLELAGILVCLAPVLVLLLMLLPFILRHH